jgi:NifU-like protein involved in Fe-S cluster formation
MDEVISKYYRKLFADGFEHSGVIDNPSIFVDNVSENLYICGTNNEFMRFYINVSGGKIEEAKYSCFCDPTANVAVEVLCNLLQNKNLVDAEALAENTFYNILETKDKELRKKVRGLLELLNIGINRYYQTQRSPTTINKMD